MSDPSTESLGFNELRGHSIIMSLSWYIRYKVGNQEEITCIAKLLCTVYETGLACKNIELTFSTSFFPTVLYIVQQCRELAVVRRRTERDLRFSFFFFWVLSSLSLCLQGIFQLEDISFITPFWSPSKRTDLTSVPWRRPSKAAPQKQNVSSKRNGADGLARTYSNVPTLFSGSRQRSFTGILEQTNIVLPASLETKQAKRREERKSRKEGEIEIAIFTISSPELHLSCEVYTARKPVIETPDILRYFSVKATILHRTPFQLRLKNVTLDTITFLFYSTILQYLLNDNASYVPKKEICACLRPFIFHFRTLFSSWRYFVYFQLFNAYFQGHAYRRIFLTR